MWVKQKTLTFVTVQISEEDCVAGFCRCPALLEFDEGAQIELVLLSQAIHPLHVHGHDFSVLATGMFPL